ncbi:succinate dehydrogenase, cytochrome b556 subunit [Pacificimonas sp. WHA3]|uniref:Succinate dehydrogenase cytochrome b556 subunit n=1 Tax=Pacificimonas pallii TaxID=2827236 RepID=A0ABS6SDQ9_9SPHN|nr:succinate dehydrogenase, cytochrome b556 subunit [Pacificimonas pallii]MBV7256552.1 succinate dehydrogenase, cytochrome b556 subunit [Pacificimonas pallii]
MATRPQVGGGGRPLSPHLSIWRWRIHTVTSIVHRITGDGLAIVGGVLFTWWLVAAASGPEAYQTFLSVATGPVGLIVGIGLTWAMFQHAASGIRHLAMDTGAGYGLEISKTTATLTWVASLLLTGLLWAFILLR